MISDGSELLLLVPAVAGIVGSVVLPVLGAVPDGAIVLFSGLGSDAQSQLEVGVGALAGSTIMLLTIPWFLSVYAGRVSIDRTTGVCTYKRPANSPDWAKLTPSGDASLYYTGVTGSPQLKIGGGLMILTALSYLIIQGPAFLYSGDDDTEVSAGEHNFALAGMITCLAFFMGYLYYQWWLASHDQDQVLEDYMEEVWRDRIMRGQISLLGVMEEELRAYGNPLTGHAGGNGGGGSVAGGDYDTMRANLVMLPPRPLKRLEALLKPFFEKYDTDKSGMLSIDEMSGVFKDLHEKVKQKDLNVLFSDFDNDGNGMVDFQEFVNGVAKYVLAASEAAMTAAAAGLPKVPRTASAASMHADDNDEAEDEEEEIPEDLADLSAEEQQFRIKLRAAWMMALGTGLVLLFSDPMVDVLDELGTRTGISSFYISFVLAPLASNASELIASFNYALKKTTKTITISLSALQGACCMNNTFCLGVFMLLIYFRELAWAFSAETTTILVIEIVMAIVSQRSTHRLIDAIGVICLYPLSIMIVAGLEAIGWD